MRCARTRYRDDELRDTRFVIDKTLQHTRKFWGREHEIRKLVKHNRSAPIRPLGLARQAREKHSPISVVDIGESGEPSANRFGEIPSLNVRRGKVGDGVEPVMLFDPFQQQACFA